MAEVMFTGTVWRWAQGETQVLAVSNRCCNAPLLVRLDGGGTDNGEYLTGHVEKWLLLCSGCLNNGSLLPLRDGADVAAQWINTRTFAWDT